MAYSEAMSIPISRRVRLLERKEELERRRAAEMKAAAAQSRLKGGR